MSQGARSTRKTKPESTSEWSMQDWLQKRGLLGEKKMEFGGKWFRFVRSAPPAQLAAYSEAYNKGDLVGALSAFLVDPTERDELAEALETQPQPLDAKQTTELLLDIINFLVAGDAGESSAS
ncbi:MAG TPA: hypothetical protein VEB22_09735 [Phycisphaerales bacterium]|jgi:hypothetical protein|nr:hypothetical protein [Phycisphaerales bacterium]